MNINDTRILHRAGHEIGAHTIHHKDLTAMTPDEAAREIKGSRDFLLTIGSGAIDMFSYPFGAYNDTVVDLVKKEGFIGARTTNGGDNEKSRSDTYLLNRRGVKPSVTLDQMKAWIDGALAKPVWVIILTHRVADPAPGDGTTPANLRALFEYVKEKKVRVVTSSGGVSFLKP